MLSHSVLLQESVEATGEFDPIGTLVVIVLIAVFAYAAKRGWARGKRVDGVTSWGWRLAAVGAGVIALLGVVAFVMNLLAAVGVM